VVVDKNPVSMVVVVDKKPGFGGSSSELKTKYPPGQCPGGSGQKPGFDGGASGQKTRFRW
jgi:hypothetical protein